MVNILQQALSGLQSMHGMVHGAIRPSNLFWGTDERLRLSLPYGEHAKPKSKRTRTYRAPGITDVNEPRHDLYSLGVSALRLLGAKRVDGQGPETPHW